MRELGEAGEVKANSLLWRGRTPEAYRPEGRTIARFLFEIPVEMTLFKGQVACMCNACKIQDLSPLLANCLRYGAGDKMTRPREQA